MPQSDPLDLFNRGRFRRTFARSASAVTANKKCLIITYKKIDYEVSNELSMNRIRYP